VGKRSAAPNCRVISAAHSTAKKDSLVSFVFTKKGITFAEVFKKLTNCHFL
jgi:hypothetical protein